MAFMRLVMIMVTMVLMMRRRVMVGSGMIYCWLMKHGVLKRLAFAASQIMDKAHHSSICNCGVTRCSMARVMRRSGTSIGHVE